MRRREARRAGRARGAALIEFALVLPVLLVMMLGTVQAALAFHAKSNLNYAAFQAARAGSVEHAAPQAMFDALGRALVPYFGGGNSTADLAGTLARVRADLAQGSARLEILSPTARSYDDFQSPDLARRIGAGRRVIPNVDLLNRRCPRDRPACAWNPATNASGQSLQDANLLVLRLTYGIPPMKQVPLAGRLYTASLKALGVGGDDAFMEELLDQGRIPVIARALVRMSSEPIESGPVHLSGAAGAAGPPGGGGAGGGGAPGGGGGGTPGDGTGGTGGPPRPPPHCRPGDPRCDPDCGVRLCCGVPPFTK
ncbi:MAG: TadE family protein [Steroidobacteraceae bacterium]